VAAAADVGEWRETGDMAACRALLQDPSVLAQLVAFMPSGFTPACRLHTISAYEHLWHISICATCHKRMSFNRR